MNHFEEIQRKVSQQEQVQTKNILQPSNAIQKMAKTEKERKEDYIFTL
ncbi:hypothetical protein [Enterococcus faecalis]